MQLAARFVVAIGHICISNRPDSLQLAARFVVVIGHICISNRPDSLQLAARFVVGNRPDSSNRPGSY